MLAPQVRPSRVKWLDLSLNPLGTQAGVAILGALANECTLYLDMSSTGLGGAEAGVAIGKLLRCHTIALRHLDIKHNALGRDGVNAVFWALRRNSSLAFLDLSENGAGPELGTEGDKLGEYGITAIGSALTLNQTLRFLDLGNNGLSVECCVNLTASLRSNWSLAEISLDSNNLDDDSALAIARKLRGDKQIERLDLSSNRVSWRGALELAAALADNDHLESLRLANNRLGEGGISARVGPEFGDALVRNKTLTHLDLEGNTLGPTGGVAIAKALHCNSSLVELNIQNNR